MSVPAAVASGAALAGPEANNTLGLLESLLLRVLQPPEVGDAPRQAVELLPVARECHGLERSSQGRHNARAAQLQGVEELEPERLRHGEVGTEEVAVAFSVGAKFNKETIDVDRVVGHNAAGDQEGDAVSRARTEDIDPYKLHLLQLNRFPEGRVAGNKKGLEMEATGHRHTFELGVLQGADRFARQNAKGRIIPANHVLCARIAAQVPRCLSRLGLALRVRSLLQQI
mmetsp:Transcript_43082/g.125346  ORF Transcript_43082/g.125346 Transcript_43082/m.125346 type:complete len:228 (+) Transcript_43082:953-1636(+)